METNSSFTNAFDFSKHLERTFLMIRLLELVFNTKSLALPPLALTIAAKTSLKALGNNLRRSTAATISGELRILLNTFSSIKSGVALYLEES